MLRRYLSRLKNNNRGAAVIEFAIALPILVILVLGIVEFGWILNGHITLTGAAREGVRAAIVGGDYQDAVDKHLEPLENILSVNSLTLNPLEGTIGNKMTVNINASMPLLTRFFDWLGVGGIYELNAEATMRYVGESAGGLPPGSGPAPEPDPGPTPPPVPTGSISGNHLNVSNVLNNATVYLYEEINGEPIATQTTNHNQTSVQFNNAARTNKGKTLYFRQEITVDGETVVSDYGSIYIPE